MSCLFLFDEIDKMGQGRSDPAYSLLEILDPEQNDHFIDRYIELPVDLSNSIFICTANDIDAVHPALKDRMEIIEFRNYSFEERIIILKDYIIPRIEKSLNSTKIFDITWKEEVFETICKIEQIRQIDKITNAIYRKAITMIYMQKIDKVNVDNTFLESIMKQPKKINKPLGFN